MKKSISLLLCIIWWILVPQASEFSYIIRYLLMFMLFMSFLWIKVSLKIFSKKEVYFVLLANLLIWALWYLLLYKFDSKLALIALMVWMTPTATASPAVLRFLKWKVDFAISAVLVTNIVIAIIFPFIFKTISDIDISLWSLLIQILTVILVPLLLAQLLQYTLPKKTEIILKYKNLSFYAWLLVCFVAVAKASNFIQNSDTNTSYIILIASVSAAICLISFKVWSLLGGKKLKLETSQTLGQKNTMLTLWIAMTYFWPLIALGPITYLVWHNLYNAFKLSRCK